MILRSTPQFTFFAGKMSKLHLKHDAAAYLLMDLKAVDVDVYSFNNSHCLKKFLIPLKSRRAFSSPLLISLSLLLRI